MMLVPYPTLLKPSQEKHIIHGVRGVLPTCRMVAMDHGTTGAHVAHVTHGGQRTKGHRSSRRIQFHALAHHVERPLAPQMKKMPNLGHMPIVFQSSSPAGSPKYSILCYGDSLTAGFCDKGMKFEPYGRTLAKMLGTLLKVPCEVLVCGHSGHTAAEMVANMDQAAITDVGGQVGKGLRRSLADASRQPDLVLLMTGTNDIGKGVEPSAVLEEIIKLHEVCKKHGVLSVALSPPPIPMDASAEATRRRLRDLLAMWSSSVGHVQGFIDPGHLVPSNCSKSWDPDRLHFSPAGSQLLGQQLAHAILPMLTRRSRTA
eukprot:Skav236692  [mRNA]  locus=scaffold847:291979:313758:- [translate_table: standard]